ncbi:MAG: imidazole glycerol phosphate synthase subunit HisH, partial [Candidatus Magasanikbacteria bacterium]|nr:imidazole glycerol phosphate synthase subunit HisH [Candidatus Magasanikbacteria bacterium]
MTMLNKTVIIDYGMSNLDSIKRALEECGANVSVVSQADDLKGATHIVLPGVGAFNEGMRNLLKGNTVSELNDLVFKKGVPFLGICLGMQLLVDKGFEGGETAGLGWIKGETKQMIKKIETERLPHVGWDQVSYKKDSVLFKDIPENTDFYFVHSYHVVCEDISDIVAYTNYCDGFVSAVEKNNIFGVQFHP